VFGFRKTFRKEKDMENKTMGGEDREQFSVEKRQLDWGEKMSLAGREPLVSREEMLKRKGLNAAILTGIRAGDKWFMVFDLRETPVDNETGRKIMGNGRLYKADYLLIDETFGKEAGKGLKGIRAGRGSVEVGRDYTYAGRFAYTDAVSRDHFALEADGDGLWVINRQPTNATEVIYGQERNKWGDMADEQFGGGGQSDEDGRLRSLEESMHGWSPESQEFFGQNPGGGQ
jgi:hypothetical protein